MTLMKKQGVLYARLCGITQLSYYSRSAGAQIIWSCLGIRLVWYPQNRETKRSVI